MRIILAISVVILAAFLVIKSREESACENCEISRSPNSEERSYSEGGDAEISGSRSETDKMYYYFDGFSDLVELELEAKLSRLGVPGEDFDNPGEYLSKDELYLLDKKSELAAKLDENVLEATAKDLEKLTEIFDFEDFEPLDSAPDEYESLKDLLDEYQKSLNTVEDYDIIET